MVAMYHIPAVLDLRGGDQVLRAFDRRNLHQQRRRVGSRVGHFPAMRRPHHVQIVLRDRLTSFAETRRRF